MNAGRMMRIGLLAVAALALGGCTSPNIVLEPSLLTAALAPAQPSARPATVTVEAGVMESPTSKYEESSEKTLIGKSESLGIHLSDIWIEERPATFLKRLVQADMEHWGYRVTSSGGELNVQVRVNKFSMGSRAINAFQFQADGVIDATLNVTRSDGTNLYSGHYRADCTRKTASEMPRKEYLQKIFDHCVSDFQVRLQSDGALRAALQAGSAAK